MDTGLGDTELVEALPAALQPPFGYRDLTAEERSEWEKLQTLGPVDSGKAAFLLFASQRRATRSWTVGCAVTAAVFGLGMGYLAWGRK